MKELTRRDVAIACLLLVAALTLRLVFFPPVLIHANFHGGPLVESILDPWRRTHRAEYGRVSFVVLWALSFATGRNFSGIALANQIIGVATLGLMALLALRWGANKFGAGALIVLGALNPLFARVGGSEDAHGLATFIGVVGIVALDLYATERRRGWLVLATGALMTLPFARQTLYLWSPLAFFLVVVRTRGAMLRWTGARIGAALAATALIVRVLITMGVDTDMTTVNFLPMFFRDVSMVWAMFARHPFFDLTRFAAAYLVLSVFGIVSMMRRDRVFAAALILACASYFLLTLPFCFPVPGVELSFRLPAAMLAFLWVAFGAGALAERSSPSVAVVTVFAAAGLTAVLPGFGYARATNPFTREYRWLESVTPTLPGPVTVAYLPLHEPSPTYDAPSTALRYSGTKVRLIALNDVTPDDVRSGVYFLDGVSCHAYSMFELLPAHVLALPKDAFLKFIGYETFPALARHRMPPMMAMPGVRRPECDALRGAEVITGPNVAAPHEAPFAIYGSESFPLRLVKLSAVPR